jgi:hypothetical protein
MESGMKISPQPPNIFEFTYDFLKAKFGRKDTTVAECVNQQNLKVPPLDPLRPLLRFNRLQDKIVAYIFALVVFLVDTKVLPWLYKIWILCFATLIYLVKCDLSRIPVRYVHPSKLAVTEHIATENQMATESEQNNHEAALEEEHLIKEYISLSQCEFHILQVKVVDHSDGLTNPALHTPAHGSKAVFQITVICGRNRYVYRWR